MKITKATEITNNDACYLIYGNPGFGKTTAISFIPGKTLVINIDKSAKVLAGNPNIDIADVDVGRNIGAELQIDQAEADKNIAQAKAEERRGGAIGIVIT